MKKKIIMTALLTALAVPQLLAVSAKETLAAASYVESGPGVQLSWRQDERGWWYRFQDGSYPCDSWLKANGEWYHFDGEGYMQTGWIEDAGVYYYLSDSGAMLHDTTLELDGTEYSFDASGAASGKPQSELKSVVNGVNMIAEEQKSDVHRAADEMADSIISRITNESMNQRQKAEAVYAWIRGSFKYRNHASATRDWPTEAYQALRRRSGDCYSYYATANLLLSRCGIPCIEVIRSTDADHYWNLVNIDGSWYHFDTTPRSIGGYYCLWTDAQMRSFSARHRGCFEFDSALYPSTP